jgi:hypothetical protein
MPGKLGALTPLLSLDLMHRNQKQPRHLHQRPSSVPKNLRSLPKRFPQNGKSKHAIKTNSGCNRMKYTGPIVPELILRNLLPNAVPELWADVDPAAAWIRIRRPPT